MPEETPVVNPGEQPPVAPTTTPNLQAPTVSENVKTPNADVAENLKRAVQEERTRRQAAETELEELKRQAQTTPTPQSPNEPTPIERTFYETVASTKLLIMAKKDPFVDANLDLIESEMVKSGSDAASAVNAVKARILDSVLRDGGTVQPPQVPPTQITTTPLPETQRPELTGNSWQDARDGKISDLNDEESALVNALKQA